MLRPRAHSRREIFLRAFLPLLCVALTGCVGKKPPDALQKEQATNLPSTIRGSGWRIYWRGRLDSQAKKSSPILEADAEQGEMTNENNTPAMLLTKVHAKIFQEGKHTANLTAGKLVSNRKDRVLVGSEGVQLTSLQNPAATTLTADSMRWDMRSSKALASGSAKIVKRAVGKSPEGTIEAPKIWFDTKTGEYEVTQGD